MAIETRPHSADFEGAERRWVDEPGVRPLDGLRVLDLSRVLAGPVCGRLLAALGAEVLRVGAQHLPVIESILPDTNLGKRFTHLDFRTDEGKRRLWSLVESADVVIDGFRPGALAAAGFDRSRLWERSPGLVIVELSAYGADGPWGGRRGFDSLVQTASGIGWAGMEASGAEGPTPLPAQVLDHGTGWLAAFGALRALADCRRDGQGRVIDVALARTGAWLDGLGRIDDLSLTGPTPQDVAELLDVLPSLDGPLSHIRLPGTIEGVPIGWSQTGSRPGEDPPTWTQPD
jgi:crotonobetainyl-CoA:carnitine CoA-transferase CaiB-like acyl-CoA transferase